MMTPPSLLCGAGAFVRENMEIGRGHVRKSLTLLFRLAAFFFNDTATTEIYTLSLHDALPICADPLLRQELRQAGGEILDGALGRGIGEQSRIGEVGVDRGGVDDDATLLHVRRRRLGQVEH